MKLIFADFDIYFIRLRLAVATSFTWVLHFSKLNFIAPVIRKQKNFTYLSMVIFLVKERIHVYPVNIVIA